MKLGILTFHSAHNYGATLQAYGLYKYLEQQGHETYVIDYRPDYITNSYLKDGCRQWLSRNVVLCIKRLLYYIRYRKIRHKRWEGFNQFINSRFNFYPYSQNDAFSYFDAVFIGSDQVWSPYHTGGQYDPVMFGKGFKCKVISYAPSTSQAELNDEQKAKLRDLLQSVICISTREEKFKYLLMPLTGKSISVVVDPTLLAGRKVFDKMAAPVHRSKPYILVYEIKPHQEVYEKAQSLAKQLNADIVELTNGMLGYHRDTMDEAASPEMFLGYIKNAACVVTTSFHGTAFSLLFHTSFYVVQQGNDADIRMESLLGFLNLKNRFIKMSDSPVFTAVDMDNADVALQALRETSQNFIIENLSELCS